MVLHHSASGYVLKKLANNYFSNEATVTDISNHGIYSASNFTACICKEIFVTKILSHGHSSGDFCLLTLAMHAPRLY